MQTIFKHAWVFFILVTVLNAFVLKIRTKRHIRENPKLSDGYRRCIRGILIYGNIPWIIMAVGSLSGLTNNVLEYVDPMTLNPIVLIFHGAIIFLWVLSIYWIYFASGAEFIESHPGIITKNVAGKRSNVTAREIKIFLPLMLAAGVIAMAMMWTIGVPDSYL